MHRMRLMAAMIGAAMATTTHLNADQGESGALGFKPIDESADSADWNPAAPWKIPVGFSQYVVSDETALNIYDDGRDDWHDMNTVHETGPMAGRFLYCTHEVRDEPEGGAVSVVDLKTGETTLLAQDPTYNALDGIRWTPWGTIVFAEEVDGGRFLEIELNPDLKTAAAIHDRPMVGRLAQEGIDIDAAGNVYVVDEHRGRTSGCSTRIPCGGGIYKFVLYTYGDLSAGDLYALKVTGRDGRDCRHD